MHTGQNYDYELNQVFFDDLETMSLKLISSDADLDPSLDEDSGGKIAYVSSKNLDEDQCVKVIHFFRSSQPQYYFLGNQWQFTTSGSNMWCILGIYSDFADGSARKAATSQYKTQLQTMLGVAKAKSTNFEKERSVYDQLIDRLYYAHSAYDQSSYSAFCDTTTVCAGFTSAFTVLCNGLGFDTIGVTSEGHAWNIIRIEGTWYGVDATWGDNGGGQKVYYYLNLSSSELLGQDKGSENHTPQSCYSGYLPVYDTGRRRQGNDAYDLCVRFGRGDRHDNR